MDGQDFDRITRTLTTSLSRRGTLLGLLAGVAAAGLAGGGETDAKGKGKRHKARNRRDRGGKAQARQARAEAVCYPGTTCAVGPSGYLVKCDLGGSTALQNAVCTSCNFTSANLNEANASGANLKSANFAKACLVDTDFTGANLASVNFTGAVLCRTTMANGSVNNSGCNKGTPCCPTCDAEHPCPSGQVCCDGRCRAGECCTADDCPARSCQAASCENRTCVYEAITGQPGPDCDTVCCDGDCCASGVAICEDNGECCVPRSCASQEVQCGTTFSGCGGTLNCGSCPIGSTPTCNDGTCASCATTCPADCPLCINLADGSTRCSGSDAASACDQPCTSDADCDDPDFPVCGLSVTVRRGNETSTAAQVCADPRLTAGVCARIDPCGSGGGAP